MLIEFFCYFSVTLEYANGNLMMNTETEVVREGRRGRPEEGGSASISILSDLSYAGRDQVPLAMSWGRGIWFAGSVGVAAVGVAAVVLWGWQEHRDAREGQVGHTDTHRPVMQYELARPVETDVGHVENGLHRETPVPESSSALVAAAGGVTPGAGARVAQLQPEGGPARGTNVTDERREGRPAGPQVRGRLTGEGRALHTTAPSKLKRVEKTQPSGRLGDGGKPPAMQPGLNAAGTLGSRPASKVDAPRTERDIDIITAIVR